MTATYLARVGWSVLVLERADRPGGSVLGDTVTRPGFVHDLFATNMNLCVGSPVAAELGPELGRHGFHFATRAHPTANVFPDGRTLRLHQRTVATLTELERTIATTPRAGGELDLLYERLSPALFALYGSRLDARSLLALIVRRASELGVDGGRELAQLLVSSVRELAETYLHSREARALLACWGMHLDFGPDVSSGAMFPVFSKLSPTC